MPDRFPYTSLPSTYYRVAVKALITNAEGDLLLIKDSDDQNGEWDIPGGGWEHGEDFETAMRREVQEELGVEVAEIGNIKFAVQARNLRGVITTRIGVEVRLAPDALDSNELQLEAKFIGDITEPIVMELSDAEVVARYYNVSTVHYD